MLHKSSNQSIPHGNVSSKRCVLIINKNLPRLIHFGGTTQMTPNSRRFDGFWSFTFWRCVSLSPPHSLYAPPKSVAQIKIDCLWPSSRCTDRRRGYLALARNWD